MRLIHWLPNNDDVGDTVVVVIVYDGSAVADSQVIDLSVTNVNDAPVLYDIPDIIIFEDRIDTLMFIDVDCI